jgi:hypothetical protein
MLQFTIRDVLWLTVMAAVCCSWWLHVRSVPKISLSPCNNRPSLRIYTIDHF